MEEIVKKISNKSIVIVNSFYKILIWSLKRKSKWKDEIMCLICNVRELYLKCCYNFRNDKCFLRIFKIRKNMYVFI